MARRCGLSTRASAPLRSICTSTGCPPPRGRRAKSVNIYIVRRGEGTLTIEGETHLIRTDDVVYIPAGTRHSLSNLSVEPLELFEIYAPSGERFDFVVDEE